MSNQLDLLINAKLEDQLLNAGVNLSSIPSTSVLHNPAVTSGIKLRTYRDVDGDQKSPPVRGYLIPELPADMLGKSQQMSLAMVPFDVMQRIIQGINAKESTIPYLSYPDQPVTIVISP